jgi:hypothetical protein
MRALNQLREYFRRLRLLRKHLRASVSEFLCAPGGLVSKFLSLRPLIERR